MNADFITAIEFINLECLSNNLWGVAYDITDQTFGCNEHFEHNGAFLYVYDNNDAYDAIRQRTKSFMRIKDRFGQNILIFKMN